MKNDRVGDALSQIEEWEKLDDKSFWKNMVKLIIPSLKHYRIQESDMPQYIAELASELALSGDRLFRNFNDEPKKLGFFYGKIMRDMLATVVRRENALLKRLEPLDGVDNPQTVNERPVEFKDVMDKFKKWVPRKLSSKDADLFNMWLDASEFRNSTVSWTGDFSKQWREENGVGIGGVHVAKKRIRKVIEEFLKEELDMELRDSFMRKVKFAKFGVADADV